MEETLSYLIDFLKVKGFYLIIKGSSDVIFLISSFKDYYKDVYKLGLLEFIELIVFFLALDEAIDEATDCLLLVGVDCWLIEFTFMDIFWFLSGEINGIIFFDNFKLDSVSLDLYGAAKS